MIARVKTAEEFEIMLGGYRDGLRVDISSFFPQEMDYLLGTHHQIPGWKMEIARPSAAVLIIHGSRQWAIERWMVKQKN